MSCDKQRYILVKKYLVPSKTKGELPDIKCEYIANTSLMGWHHEFTRDKEKAYIFTESELDHAKLLSDSWRIDIEKA